MKKTIGFPKPIKKKKIKKVKELTVTKAKKRANTAFSIYIRTRDSIDGLGLNCYSCGKYYPAFGKGCAQAGHFIGGRHSNVVYDERNCHGQCYMCNVVLKGNWRPYEDHMIEEYGAEVVEELKTMDRINAHLKVNDYLEIEELYKQKLNNL